LNKKIIAMERIKTEKRKTSGGNLKEAVPGDRQAMDKAWEEVIKWEAMHGGGLKCGGIKLVSYAKFKKNRSPSAMWAVFWGYAYTIFSTISVVLLT
jgi:hypothetical protein